jgi:uncharacterized protein YxeA
MKKLILAVALACASICAHAQYYGDDQPDYAAQAQYNRDLADEADREAQEEANREQAEANAREQQNEYAEQQRAKQQRRNPTEGGCAKLVGNVYEIAKYRDKGHSKQQTIDAIQKSPSPDEVKLYALNVVAIVYLPNSLTLKAAQLRDRIKQTCY